MLTNLAAINARQRTALMRQVDMGLLLPHYSDRLMPRYCLDDADFTRVIPIKTKQHRLQSELD
jgi:hypothetical protein